MYNKFDPFVYLKNLTQGQGQVITPNSICKKQLLVSGLDPGHGIVSGCFRGDIILFFYYVVTLIIYFTLRTTKPNDMKSNAIMGIPGQSYMYRWVKSLQMLEYVTYAWKPLMKVCFI